MMASEIHPWEPPNELKASELIKKKLAYRRELEKRKKDKMHSSQILQKMKPNDLVDYNVNMSGILSQLSQQKRFNSTKHRE